MIQDEALLMRTRARTAAPVRQRSEASASTALREYLLELTLRHAAAESPFYRERLGSMVGSKLDGIPLLYKRELQDRLDEMRTIRRFPDYLMYTSGTTGQPMEVPVYQEEVDAYHDLVVRGWEERIGNPGNLTLCVLRVGHGSHILTAGIPTIPCHISYGLDELIGKLECQHWTPRGRQRVRSLECNVLNIREITYGMLAAGVDPKRFQLEWIAVSGWYLPRAERAWLATVWGAPVIDRYGVTEVHGDGKWCDGCQGYHFDFTVIPEVLDPETLQPIREGRGTMVLTGLYPFNQAVPKIRYVLGDLVELKQAGCGTREATVRFLSRLTDAVRGPDGNWRLFPTDVAEVLWPLPDIARKPKTGFLKFRLSSTEGVAHLEIELTYRAAAYPGRIRELSELVETGLRARTQDLGALRITFRDPGVLSTVTKV